MTKKRTGYLSGQFEKVSLYDKFHTKDHVSMISNQQDGS